MTLNPLQPTTTDPRATARRLADASDERRRQVERVLHDGVQQHMALLGLKLSMLQKVIGSDPTRATEMCGELRQEIQGALRDLRAVAHLIYPAILENEGLTPALERAGERLGLTVRVEERGDVPAELRAPFYFCCLEALDNAARHAGPGVAVHLRIAAEDGAASFEVVDDGIGFSLRDLEEPSGLRHIADRVEALGGTLEVTSSAGETRVRATVPLSGV